LKDQAAKNDFLMLETAVFVRVSVPAIKLMPVAERLSKKKRPDVCDRRIGAFLKAKGT
jgi:hypothetical protein